MRRASLISVCALIVTILGGVAVRPAASTSLGALQTQCITVVARARGKYASCIEMTLANFGRGGQLKCVAKLAATWPLLQARFAGTGLFCDNPRYTDQGNTVLDRMTGLVWEKKTNADGTPNPSDPHDADNSYTWSGPGGGPNPLESSSANGALFMTFLPALNAPTCFDRQCDWRVPTEAELLSIVTSTPAAPCVSPPCIDPVFGPIGPTTNYVWSSTTAVNDGSEAWYVQFHFGNPGFGVKVLPEGARAVRTHSEREN